MSTFPTADNLGDPNYRNHEGLTFEEWSKLQDPRMPEEIELERVVTEWTNRRDPEGDPRPMCRAAVNLARTSYAAGKFKRSFVGPLCGILWFRFVEFDAPFLSRWAFCAYIRLTQLFTADWPAWNDFYMMLWMLSRDPRYVEELRKHLDRAQRKGRIAQVETGAWMVASVSQQDPEFGELWQCPTA